MLRNYDAVIFDLEQVITAFEAESFLHRILDDPHQATRVRRAVFSTRIWVALNKGLLTETEAEAEIIGANQEDADGVRSFFRHYKEFFIPLPAGVAILESVKQAGFQAYGLMNLGAEAWDAVRRRHAFLALFDGIVVSCQENLIKPDLAIFERLIARYALEPERCILTDDEPINVEMARHLGFDGIHFENHCQLREALEARGLLGHPLSDSPIISPA